MQQFRKTAIAGAVAIAIAQGASAGTAPFFIPLADAERVDVADGMKIVNESNPTTYTQIMGIDERTAPWKVPAGVSQKNLMSMEEVENSVDGSILRVDAGNNSSMFDMLAYDPTGRYIFIPHETPFGAGVSRYDTETDKSEILFKGDETGAQGELGFLENRDFGAFDPVRWTPNGTLIAAEEWAGTGRAVEICNPLDAAPADPNAPALNQGNCETDPNADWRVLDGLPLTSWEGIQFSLKQPQKVMYIIDEENSGSIYKVVFKVAGQYNVAQTFVLSVNNFAASGGRANENWNSAANTTAMRTGPATWIALTDADGQPLSGVQNLTEVLRDTNGAINVGGAARLAADQLGGTPYGRPEDTTNLIADNGNEVIYFAATSEPAVYAIEETPTGPFVKRSASSATPRNLGFPATTATLGSPDNLAIDSLGNIYIIEDNPNVGTIGAAGGDIWFMRDTNSDGIAESIDLFMSLQVPVSEATGMIFHPTDPTRFVVAVQHPRSTGLSDDDNLVAVTADDSDGVRSSAGFGDAVWEFDLAGVQPPACTPERRNFVTFDRESKLWVRACSSQRDFNAVKALEQSDVDTFPQP